MRVVSLGAAIFQDATLSSDGKVSCRTCHVPEHAYSDSHARSIGVESKIGTRNAPSLIGISDDDAFTWDGRRTRLEDVVLDPFTNPVEFGLPSMDVVLKRLGNEPGMVTKFRGAFPNAGAVPTREQVQTALASFVRSLAIDTSVFDQTRSLSQPLQAQAEQGRRLFVGVAGCSECHSSDGKRDRFSDGQYHHSGVEQASVSTRLTVVTHAVIDQSLDAARLGPKVLTDPDWSALGRFTVTHNPGDIGAFRTPSLRNVAATAPYMHDGSIATLASAVEHEIYYRGFSSGHPINLSLAEKKALVEFLKTLNDSPPAHRLSVNVDGQHQPQESDN